MAALYWHNLLAYRHAIPLEASARSSLSAVVVTGAAVVLVAIGLDLLLFPRHERSLASALAILAPAAAVVVPLVLRRRARGPGAAAARAARRGPSRAARRRRGHRRSLALRPRGRPRGRRACPRFARLARRGAFGPLATMRPTEGPPVWTTIMTGRLPRDHGIRSASTYRLRGSDSEWALLPKGALVGVLERVGLVSRRPVDLHVDAGAAPSGTCSTPSACPAGLVRVWGTHPPETIRGFVLSPYFHLLRGDPERAATTLYPRDLLDEIAARAVSPRDVDPALLRDLADAAARASSPLDDPALRALAEESLAPDLTYERAADVLRKAYDPSLLVVAFHGYDLAGHAFYRYAHPEAFGDVGPEDARRYGRVLGRYAVARSGGGWADIEQDLRPGDVLRRRLGPRPRADAAVAAARWACSPARTVASASHAGAPPGVLLVVGEGIQPGLHAAAAPRSLDVAPTILYLMGLPVARDMEGRVLTEILEPDFARDNPVTFIPSYESLAVAAGRRRARPLDDLPPLPEERP